jgi:Lhr-like helicase
MKSIHPLTATENLATSYRRYLTTIYPFRDRELRRSFRRQIETPGQLVKGPLLEVTPPFKTGTSVSGLISDGVLSPSFAELCSDALPLERPLYRHQVGAIEKVCRDQRNVIVATGTGSGKTESFLIPVFEHILREREQGTLPTPGVRALLLYPMNALVNDQLRRLRQILQVFPDITFGRYTGETQQSDSAAEEKFGVTFPGEPRISNEILSRDAMRSRPPHILVTNYAMLEYLLMRPEDNEFFDSRPSFWKFLVLDEAHIYDGALGSELSMLIRRVKDRVADPETRFTCIATSATLGSGISDAAAAAEFGSSLFGEAFEWGEDAVSQDVVFAERKELQEHELVHTGFTCSDYESVLALEEGGTNQDGEASALVRAVSAGLGRGESFERSLYHELRSDENLQRLAVELQKGPQNLNALAARIFPNHGEASRSLVALVRLAGRAKSEAGGASLLPSRYHLFARALEGGFVCVNGHGHAHGGKELLLSRRERCPECDSKVHEVAACRHCGAAYLVGKKELEPDGCFRIGPVAEVDDEALGKRSYFLLDGGALIESDPDFADSDDEEEKSESSRLCSACGLVSPEGEPKCACERRTVFTVREIEVESGRSPGSCLSCGISSKPIYRLLTGRDAPVSVVATSLFQDLPEADNAEGRRLPGGARKLLIFADSRQGAAFFAPYLESTYGRILTRSLIHRALLEDEEALLGKRRLQDAVTPVLAACDHLFGQDASYANRLELVRSWLFRELVAQDRRQGLEGRGLLQIRLSRPAGWVAPPALLEQFQLSEEEAWTLLSMLLTTLRIGGIVAPPTGVKIGDDIFAPRNRRYFVRHEGSDIKTQIAAWTTTRFNRRLHILSRVLASRSSIPTEEGIRDAAREALSGIWHHLQSPEWRSPLTPESDRRRGTVYALNPESWEFVPYSRPTGYRCTTCRAITGETIDNVCPSYRCSGNVEPLLEGDLADDHYVSLYTKLRPIPLKAEEHTAQWTPDEAAEVQQRFIAGHTNVLSCSTTFELGVDVGDLQSVLMQNVPPSTANYVQRAGRAGRRTGMPAFVTTYAQRGSHDLTHYANPERMVSGQVGVPHISLANGKILQRHAQAVLASAFFRSQMEEYGRGYSNLTSFFEAETEPAGAELLKAFADEHPYEVRQALLRVIPKEEHRSLGLEEWSWLRRDGGDGFLDFLDRAVAEVASDLSDYDRMEQEAAEEKKYSLAGHFKRVALSVRKKSLLGFMASRNLLPKYGFPSDVVSLHTEHLQTPVANKVRLDRDLRIAIAEYAPEAEVVAAGAVWTGGGLAKIANRDWPRYQFAVCTKCRRFHRTAGELPEVCEGCKTALITGYPARFGKFVVPQFGFMAVGKPKKPGEKAPQRQYSSRVHFAEYAPPGEQQVPSFEDSAVPGISVRYSRFGKLVVLNSGPNRRGFRVCTSCGFAAPAPKPPKRSARKQTFKPHRNPRTEAECSGMVTVFHLGHEFLTDVAEVRFSGFPELADEATGRSVLYAILEGAAQCLGIKRDDIDGTLRWLSQDEVPSMVLYDQVPGGAGHVERIIAALPNVLEAARERVDKDCCGPESSCYECLRGYRNQPYHATMSRGDALEVLREVLA